MYHYTLDGRTDLEMKSDTLQQSKSFTALTFVAANKRMYTKICQKRAEKFKKTRSHACLFVYLKFKEGFRSQCYLKLSCNLIRYSHRVSNIWTKPWGISWKTYTKIQQNGGTAIKWQISCIFGSEIPTYCCLCWRSYHQYSKIPNYHDQLQLQYQKHSSV